MAIHSTNAQLQTILAKTVSNLKPFEVATLADALSRRPHVEDPDGGSGANAVGFGETILGTLFPAGTQQW